MYLSLSLCSTSADIIDIVTRTHTHGLDSMYTHTLNLPNGNSCCTKAWLVRLQTVAPYTQHLSKIHHSLEDFGGLFPRFQPLGRPIFSHVIIPLASLSCVASHLYPSAIRGISCTNGKPKAASKMWDGHQHLDPLIESDPMSGPWKNMTHFPPPKK